MPLNATIAINQNPTLPVFGRQRDPQLLPQPQHAAVLQLPLHQQFRQAFVIAAVVVPESRRPVIDPTGCHAVGPVETSIVRRIACEGEQA